MCPNQEGVAPEVGVAKISRRYRAAGFSEETLCQKSGYAPEFVNQVQATKV